MTEEFPNTTEEQEREYARVLWKAQEARNELSMLAAGRNVRQRSKFRLLGKIALWLTAISAWTALVLVVRYLYVNF